MEVSVRNTVLIRMCISRTPTKSHVLKPPSTWHVRPVPMPAPRSDRGRRAASPSRASGGSRRVALIGSSGGSTLRGAVLREVESLQAQLAQLPDVQLADLLFVEASCPLDHALDNTPALLWKLDNAGQPLCTKRGRLKAVNLAARELDAKMAGKVSAGKIDALILVSAHFGDGGVNVDTLAAAVKMGVPALGTGGTCTCLSRCLAPSIDRPDGLTREVGGSHPACSQLSDRPPRQGRTCSR